MSLFRLLCLAVLLLLPACAQTVVPAPKSGAHYLQEGDTFFEQENYTDAIAAWEKVRETYTSPEMTATADYRIAEAHYLNQDYLEAALAFESFLQQHPDHEKHADALYYLGRSYYEQMLSPDLDQTATRNARTTFTNFLRRYPKDTRADHVRDDIAACTARLAEHELYVGRFYLRTDNYFAAIKRLAAIPTTYPGFTDLDIVYLYLGQAYLRNGQRAEAAETFNTLYKLFPSSKAVDKARKTLAKEY